MNSRSGFIRKIRRNEKFVLFDEIEMENNEKT
jgi:hypothetical protein